MGAYFRTDPSIALRGIAPAFDPIAAMSRIANLRRLQQRGQVNKLQLEDFQRERNRQTAIRGAAIRSRGDRAKFLQELSQVAPVARFDYEAQFAKQDIELGKDKRAARKTQLENASKTFELIGQLAGPLDFLEQQGADIETLQVAYADSLGKLADAGIDTSKLPPEYKPGMAQQAMMEAVTEKDRIDQALRADEAAERKAAREKKVPGVHIPFSPKVEAQKKRISAARWAGRPTARALAGRDAELVQRTAQGYIQRAGNPTTALQWLEEDLRRPDADPNLLRLAQRIRNQIQDIARGVGGRTRGGVEDEVDDALNRIVQE